MNSRASLMGLLRRVQPDPHPHVEDAELLERYARRKDEDAFAALIDRHGPLVWGVARRCLGDFQQAEDVFQAVFLALARSAGALQRRTTLANWLYTVALRLARKTQARNQRWQALDRCSSTRSSTRPDPLQEITGRELLRVIDEEIARLPERFRLPVLLCCVQGLSREEVSQRLGWSMGAVKSRLERGRRRLAVRLQARGLTSAVMPLASLAMIAVPTALLARTIAISTGQCATVSPSVAALSAGPPSYGLLGAVLVFCAVGLGLIGWAFAALSPRPPETLGDKVAPPVLTENPEPKAGAEMEVTIADGVKLKFCWVPAGKRSRLGSPREEADRGADEAEHDFETKGFWLAKYPVTQAEWKAVMGDNPSWFRADRQGKMKLQQDKITDTTRFPIEQVSWNDCQLFLGRLNQLAPAAKPLYKSGKFVLPHEDEWEYACRGGKGNKQPFYFGNELNGTQANCWGDRPYGGAKACDYKGRPTEVGSYARDWPHPWGLCDMHGNVWQWCNNEIDQVGHRAVRGGSWRSPADMCRSAYRGLAGPDLRDYICGFRVCLRLE